MSEQYFKNISSVSIDKCFTELSFAQNFLTIIDLSLTEDPARLISNKFCNLCSPIIYIVSAHVINSFEADDVASKDHFIPYPCDYEVFTYYIERFIKGAKNRICNLLEKRVEIKPRDYSVPKSINGYFLGNSSAIVKLRKQIDEVSKQDCSVLLLGETGSGKTTAASLIHKNSIRSDNPFVRIKCEDIVESMAVSTLFGSVKGSYTNATKDVEGRIKSGKGGVLFFDEFGCLSFETQSLFITFSEDKIFSKLGSNKSESVDARMLFATNVDIRQSMEEGKFRPDVYFRIAKRDIYFPPLRERKEDIPVMVEDYCNRYQLFVDESVINFLLEYHWPGNLRQFYTCLDNAREHCRENHIRYTDIDLGYLGRDYFLINLS